MKSEASGEKRAGEELRKTKGLNTVLSILGGSEPMTADDIFMRAHTLGETLSLSTVYRICEKLAQRGIVCKTTFSGDAKARYEYHSEDHHHHAVCTGCRRIIPIDDCPFGEFDKLLRSKYGFDVKSHSLEIYGLCGSCKKTKKG